MYFVYLIQCEDKSIYTGINTDTKRRFQEHKDGIGAYELPRCKHTGYPIQNIVV